MGVRPLGWVRVGFRRMGSVTGSGAFPGYGGVPPAVASAGSAGSNTTVSRSNHTHALDLVAYNPSLAGMQASGVVQQVFSSSTATPSVLTMTQFNIPMGNATGGLTQDIRFAYNTTSHRLAITDTNAPNFTLDAAVFNVVTETTATPMLWGRYQSGSGAFGIVLQRARGTQAVPLTLQGGDAIFQQSTTAHDGTTYRNTLSWGTFLPVTAVVATNSVPQVFAMLVNGGAPVVSLTTSFLQHVLRVDTAFNVMAGSAALAAASVAGWLWFPGAAGAFTGVPAITSAVGSAGEGRYPVGIDTTNFRLYYYDSNGAGWRFAQFADFAPTYNSVTAVAATGLTLTGNGNTRLTTTAGTLTLDTQAAADVILQAAGVTVLTLDNATARLKIAAASSTANNAQVVTIGATGPNAIGTPATAAAWLTFLDPAGVASFIPYWQ